MIQVLVLILLYILFWYHLLLGIPSSIVFKRFVAKRVLRFLYVYAYHYHSKSTIMIFKDKNILTSWNGRIKTTKYDYKKHIDNVPNAEEILDGKWTLDMTYVEHIKMTNELCNNAMIKPLYEEGHKFNFMNKFDNPCENHFPRWTFHGNLEEFLKSRIKLFGMSIDSKNFSNAILYLEREGMLIDGSRNFNKNKGFKIKNYYFSNMEFPEEDPIMSSVKKQLGI